MDGENERAEWLSLYPSLFYIKKNSSRFAWFSFASDPIFINRKSPNIPIYIYGGQGGQGG